MRLLEANLFIGENGWSIDLECCGNGSDVHIDYIRVRRKTFQL
ncbi:hypothetical protein [Bacteroides sp.]|nr:hypothetical protein [Bacteroides sp.]